MTETTWRRGSFCDSGACVEVAFDGDRVLVRNSERPDAVTVFTRAEWRVFVAGIVDAGDFRT